MVILATELCAASLHVKLPLYCTDEWV